ncbi:MAG: hypothetical protein N3G22_04060 [Candidatus Micrarchaeota archaeon]|nr:hypothetical protein [Candidatus Micrarchaeota archaeon]
MGAVRDFFKRLGVLGSAANTISNAGQRLLDLKNEFGKIGAKQNKNEKQKK